MPQEGSEIYEFGDFRLNVREHRLDRLKDSVESPLPDKAFQTLVALLRSGGSLVTKDELLSTVWPDAIVEENNLGKAIHAIRGALSDLGPDHQYIETVPKHGYRFVAALRRIGANGRPDPAVGPSGQAVGSKVFPGRSPAYDLYVRGKVKAGSENVADTENAIKILEAAVAIDPYFAPAYAQLARAFNTRAFKFSAGPERKLLHENADVAVEKALALDPELAEGHFARGLILWTNTKGFPHEQAIKAYLRSLALDPDFDEAHHQLSMIYAHVGLIDEAQSEVETALEINPNNTMARFRVGIYYAYQGKFDEAARVFKSIPRDVSPMLVDRCIADLLVQTGRLADANEIVEKYLESHPEDEGGSFTSVKALLLARAGESAAAAECIGRATEIGRDYGHFHHTAHNIASAYAAMGNPVEAVKWLEVAADGGFPNYSYFKLDPNLDPIRGHTQFAGFLKRLRPQWLRFKQLAAGQN